MKRKLVTMLDLCLIGLIIILTILAMFFRANSSTGRFVVVSVNEQTVVELSLSDNQTKRIETNEGYNIVVIKNKECTVTEADCRDGICVNHNAISKVGQSIVCLPHKLIVEIK